MKLCVSNIAWNSFKMEDHLKVLAESGCQGLEFSASKLWEEPVDVSLEKINAFKQKVNNFGLEIPSMHSLLYTRPDLTMFDSSAKSRLIKYILDLGRIAERLECPIMIFGSGRSRQIDQRDPERCFTEMVETFREIAKNLKPLGVTLLIESLSRKECDSINNMKEANALCEAIDHPNFGLHLDLRVSYAEQENLKEIWKNFGNKIRHCHVANPELKSPDESCPYHRQAGEILRKGNYKHYLSIEMIPQKNDTIIQLKDALNFVKKTYFNGEIQKN